MIFGGGDATLGWRFVVIGWVLEETKAGSGKSEGWATMWWYCFAGITLHMAATAAVAGKRKMRNRNDLVKM